MARRSSRPPAEGPPHRTAPRAATARVPSPERSPAAERPRAGQRSRAGDPVGSVTRGTTAPNRLRRMDRWIADTLGAALRRSHLPPIAVDLGFGAAPWTAVELLARLRAECPGTQVLGVEIDPERVAAALPFERAGLSFVRGGFEVPLPGATTLPCLPAPRDGGGGSAPGTGRPRAERGAATAGGAAAGAATVGERRPLLIRAANVLRQYRESEVAPHWSLLCARLAPGGLLVEGTCDEIGRRHVWVALGPEGPRSVTFATRLGSLATPSDLAERLPKALIHRNVPGEPVHAFLRDFDRAWASAAPYASLGARQRWMRSVGALSADWPVLDGPRRWRQGELTVAWPALAPRD